MHTTTTDDMIYTLALFVVFLIILVVGWAVFERSPRFCRALERFFEKTNKWLTKPTLPEPLKPKYPQKIWKTDPEGKITLLSVKWKPDKD